MRNIVPIELPEKYYLDYFESLLGFVEEKCGALLNRQEKSFYRKFRQLSEPARCLFVRLANRRGAYFRTAKLQYAEVPDLEDTLDELIGQKFFCDLAPRHAVDLGEILGIFPKPDLLTLFRQLDPDWSKSVRLLKKPELVERAVSHFRGKQLTRAIRKHERVVRVNFEQELEMLRFLYFGDIHGDMTQFVVRDLGLIKTEAYDEDKLQAYFKTRREAEDKLLISKIYHNFKVLRDEELAPAEAIYAWFAEQKLLRTQFCELAWPLFDKLSLRLGKLLEQQKHPKFALQVYQHTHLAPARERCVRLMHKLGLQADALRLCDTMLAAPQNAEERYFAQDFQDRIRQRKRTKRTTDFLKGSDAITLDEAARYYVEGGVLEYFCDLGYEGVHTENYLWRSFFGLLFWDIIFDQDCEALHHPMQITPTDFYTPAFLRKRKQQLLARLKVLQHPNRFYDLIQHHYETKLGISNPLVGWHDSILPLVAQCYDRLTLEQISSILLEMAKDLRENTRGFPDLFVWNQNSYRFIEVKSPNDHLSAQQLHWLHFFQRQGVVAEVIRVRWKKR
jgi:hypothetical protein